MAAIAGHDGMLMLFDVVEQAELLERFDDGIARFVSIHAAELAVTLYNMRGFVEYVDARKVVALAHAPVVGVMSGRDLDEAGTEFGIDDEVLENGNLAVDKREHDLGSNEFLLRRVFRGNGNASVAEHRLRARRGDDNVFDAIDRLDQRIAQMPQMARFLDVLSLVVRNGGRAMRAPVHDALAAVDQIVMVPVGKRLAHGSCIVGIECEVLVVVVARAAHALDLVDDRVAVLFAPFPALIDEGLAPDLKTGDAFVGKLLVNLGLRGDAGVVGSEHPTGRSALHAGMARAGVLNRIVERMAHVEDARDVWRRDDDGVGVIGEIAFSFAALEVTCLVPRIKQRNLVRCEIVVNLLVFVLSHQKLLVDGG